MDQPQHAENAKETMGLVWGKDHYINVVRDLVGRANVTFTIQSAPVSEVGENGCQATDMLEYVKNLFQSLNDTFPCRENALTITKIEEAIHWQDARTKDREKRKVEGKNSK